MSNFISMIKSIVPYLPTLVIIYAIVKLLSSGLGLVSKVLSVIILVVVAYLSIVYLGRLLV